MIRRRSSPRVRLAMAMVALTFLPACSLPGFLRAEQPEDGVTVRSYTADLDLGRDQAAEAGLVSGITTSGPLAALDQLFTLDEPDAPPSEEPPDLPPPPPRPDCPEPTDATFPEKAATTDVVGEPVPGVYQWRQKGTSGFVGLPQGPVPPLTSRTVRRVATLRADALFAYEIAQTGIGYTEIDTIEVRRTEAGAATDGIYLTRLQYKAPRVEIDFNPLPGTEPQLTRLPLDETPVAASAVDPQDGLVLQITGVTEISDRVRLNGCGEVVEAWKFSGTRVLQSLANQDDRIGNPTYELFIAPQLGGFIVGDHVVAQSSFGGFQFQSDVTSNIGRVNPVRPQ